MPNLAVDVALKVARFAMRHALDRGGLAVCDPEALRESILLTIVVLPQDN